MKPTINLIACSLVFLTLLSTACSPKPEPDQSLIAQPEIELKKVPGPKAELSLGENLEPTSLAWETTKIDFGAVEQNVELVHKFIVKNTGQQPLKLINVKPSCNCTASDFSREEIAPGQSGFVEAKYSPDKSGAFNKTITVTTNTPERNYVLTLNGEGKNKK